MHNEVGRIICHFSCGATSAIATKLALATYPRESVMIVNAYVEEEHPDNRRFLADCERWFDHPVTVLRDERFGASAREVWKRERFMMSRKGAPCSRALKRDLLDAFRTPEDRIVIGYAADEMDRFERFFDPVGHHPPICPLIERGLLKSDCLAILERAGIELPEMYRLGFNNANCIGCVKGGKGYWNHVRLHFPERFAEIADIQAALGPGANFWQGTNGERISLRDLPPDAGRHQEEPEISCGLMCEATEAEMLFATTPGIRSDTEIT